MIHGQHFKTFSTPLFDNIRIKETIQIRMRFFFVPFKHNLKALFVGIPKVQEQAFSENRKCTIVVHGRPFTMFSISLYDDIRRKEASQKEEFANSLYLSNTF